MIPKFRAWDKFYECMITPAGIELENGEVSHIIEQLPGETTKSSITYYELMQSTGLKDKNGVEIYIGDILEWEMVMGHGWYEDGVDVVIYDEKELKIKMKKRNNDTLNRVVAVGCEVVGNIYEHPHLLKE